MTSTTQPICLILAHDVWSIHFDRRILNQADILADEGYSVFIACFRKKAARKSAQGTPPPIESVQILNGRSYRLIICTLTDCAELPSLPFPFTSFKTSPLRAFIKYLALTLFKGLSRLFPDILYFAEFKQTLATQISSPLPFDLPLVQTILKEHSSDASGFRLSSSSLIISCDSTTARAGYMLKDLFSCRLWFDMHEYYSQQRVFQPATKRYISCVENFVCKRADRVYTVNPMLAERISSDMGAQVLSLQNYYVPSPPLSLDLTQNSASSQATPLNILFHGGAGPFRNIPNLVKAFINMPPDLAHLTMFQHGMSRSLLGAASNASQISVHGFFDGQLLDYFLSQADAIIIPYAGIDVNTVLCSPNKLGDAIALGKPVLFNSELLYLRSLASHYPSLIPVNCSSPQALSSSILAAIPLIHKITPAQKQAIYDDLGAPSQSEMFRQWVRQLR